MQPGIRVGLAICATLLFAAGCAPHYHIESGTLPNGEVSDVRVMAGEVLDEDQPFLCRSWQNEEICATSGYWVAQSRHQRELLIAKRMRAPNAAATPPPPTMVGAGK
jgi:hypothetical protein